MAPPAADCPRRKRSADPLCSVLGGGTAVNAGLWWKPHPRDWDHNFPAEWKAADMAAATERVFSRIPGVSGATHSCILRREGARFS